MSQSKSQNLILNIPHQEEYSRGQVILRQLLGAIYIGIPHGICLYILGIGAAIIGGISFWIVLFTGKYPKGLFNFEVKFIRWFMRVAARMFHLADGYPKFGLNPEDPAVTFDIEYLEKVNRGHFIKNYILNYLLLFIHAIVLTVRVYIGLFLNAITFWVVLFTGKSNAGIHKFNTGTLRWIGRVLGFVTCTRMEFIPFNGKPSNIEDANISTINPVEKKTTKKATAAGAAALGTAVAAAQTMDTSTDQPQKQGLVLNIPHQEEYSRGQVILRQLLGAIYIGIPHGICLYILGIGAAAIGGIGFWIVLFTGKYPKGLFNFEVKFIRWFMRVAARMFHLADGYPKFGLNSEDPAVTFDIEYLEKVKRGSFIKNYIINYLLLFIHAIVLTVRVYIGLFLNAITFWVVLFTGKSNAGIHKFNTGTLRWIGRVLGFVTCTRMEFIPFNGKASASSNFETGNSFSQGEKMASATAGAVVAGAAAVAAQTSSTITKVQAVDKSTGATKTVLVKQADGKIVKKKVPVNPTTPSKPSDSETSTKTETTQATPQKIEKSATETSGATKTVLVKQPDGKIVKKVVPAQATTEATSNQPVKQTTPPTPKSSKASAKGATTPPPTATGIPIKESEQNNEKKGVSVLFLILTVLFLLSSLFVGFLYWDLDQKFLSKQMEWTESESSLNDQIASLKTQYAKLQAENDSLREVIESPEKNEKLQSMITENNDLKERLNQLQKSLRRNLNGNSGDGNAAAYKRKINDLQTKVEALEAEMQGLTDKNTTLENEKAQIGSALASAKSDADKFKRQAKTLEDKIEDASALSIDDIMAGGIKYKSEDKKKDKDKAKSLDKIQVCFTILMNKLADSGSKDVYAIITSPSGKVLSRGNQTATLEGTEMEYSLYKSQSYNGKEELVCMYYDKNSDDLETGSYKVNIYIDGQKAGESSFSLR